MINPETLYVLIWKNPRIYCQVIKARFRALYKVCYYLYMEGKKTNIQENNKNDNQRRPEAEERGGQGQG